MSQFKKGDVVVFVGPSDVSNVIGKYAVVTGTATRGGNIPLKWKEPVPPYNIETSAEDPQTIVHEAVYNSPLYKALS